MPASWVSESDLAGDGWRCHPRSPGNLWPAGRQGACWLQAKMKPPDPLPLLQKTAMIIIAHVHCSCSPAQPCSKCLTYMGYFGQSSWQRDGIGTTMFPILQMGKLRLRLWPDQGHIAKQWQKWNLGLLSIISTKPLVQSSDDVEWNKG